MAGKIVADTLEHSTAGSIATNYVVNGSAKAWIHFVGNVNPPTTQDSFNFASITDSGTGNFELSFTSSMSAATYSGCCNGDTWGGSTTFNDGSANTTSALSIGGRNDAAARQDQAVMTAMAMGDLA